MNDGMREDQTMPARARRGRKPKNKAVTDFTVSDAIEEYQAKRAELRAKKKESFGPAALAPYEAATEDMRGVRKEIGNISTKRLLNLMSEFRRCKDAEAIEIAPDEYDPPDHIPNPVR